jgi:hypothetical protein
MVQQLFLGPNAATNVAGLMKSAAGDLLSKVTGFSTDVFNIGPEVQSFADDLVAVVESGHAETIKPNLEANTPKMKEQLEDIKQKTAGLQARINSKSDFSPQRMSSLIGSLSAFKALIPAGTQLSSLFTKDTLSSILPGDIFSGNFTKLYSLYDNISNNISAMEKFKGSTAKSMEALSTGMSMINSVIGQLGTLSNKQFKTDLSDESSDIVQQMKQFGEALLGHVFPMDEVKSLDRDVRALAKAAEDIVSKGKIPAIENILSLAARAQDTVNSIVTNMDTVKTVINVFEPPITTDVNAFMSSIGNIAPAALEAIVQGEMVEFEKSIKDPMMLTLAGQAVSQLNTFMKSQTNLTVADSSDFGTLISFLSGQHKRQTQAAYVSNTGAQRSRALKSFDIFVNKYMTPMKLLTDAMAMKFGGSV